MTVGHSNIHYARHSNGRVIAIDYELYRSRDDEDTSTMTKFLQVWLTVLGTNYEKQNPSIS